MHRGSDERQFYSQGVNLGLTLLWELNLENIKSTILL